MEFLDQNVYFEAHRQTINLIIDRLAPYLDKKIGFSETFDSAVGNQLYKDIDVSGITGKDAAENSKINDQLAGCLQTKIGMSEKIAKETAHQILHQLNKARLNNPSES